MSNEPADSADEGAFSADERPFSARDRRVERAAEEALHTAFAARLAEAIPRSGIDVSLLQYEAGYRAGLAERRKSARVAQGFALLATAAMLFAAVSSWMNYEAFSSERQALIAATRVPAPVDRDASDARAENEPPQVVSTDDAAEEDPAPAKRSLRPRGADVLAAGAAMERRYLTPRLRLSNGDLQWKDLYDLSTEPVSTSVAEPSGSGGSASSPASPSSTGGPASPWSAWPRSRQVEDLLEQGI